MRRDDMYLFCAAGDAFLDDFYYFLVAHRVRVGVFAVCGKCAKFTHVRADIGRVYVAIYVKKYLFAVQFSPFGICEFTQRKKV